MNEKHLHAAEYAYNERMGICEENNIQQSVAEMQARKCAMAALVDLGYSQSDAVFFISKNKDFIKDGFK